MTTVTRSTAPKVQLTASAIRTHLVAVQFDVCDYDSPDADTVYDIVLVDWLRGMPDNGRLGENWAKAT